MTSGEDIEDLSEVNGDVVEERGRPIEEIRSSGGIANGTEVFLLATQIAGPMWE